MHKGRWVTYPHTEADCHICTKNFQKITPNILGGLIGCL